MTATAKKKCFVSERKVTPYGQSKGFVRYPLKNLRRPTTTVRSMRGSRKFSRGGGGGRVQIPRRGLTENFNMAKINNLAIITRWGGGGGGRGPDPLSPPLDPSMRPTCGFVSERLQKADSEIVRCPYEL